MYNKLRGGMVSTYNKLQEGGVHKKLKEGVYNKLQGGGCLQ